MSRNRQILSLLCLAALAAALAGCSHASKNTTPAPVLTPEARQAMRRDMIGPGTKVPAQSQNGSAGN